MSVQDLAQAAREYRELQAFIKELEAQADALKQEMIRELDARQAETLQAGEFTIRWSIYESKRLDTTALKKALPDVAEQFTKATVSTRFQVA